jgi:hypothetical protein
MCKHLAIINKTLTNGQIDKIQKDFTKNFTSEKDGIGRFSVGITGHVSIERTLKDYLPPNNKILSNILGETSQKNGYVDEITRFSVIHGRFSTNEKGLKNCHPIETKKGLGTHNGVVQSSKFKNKLTKNDTELALYHLEARDFDGLTGYASLFYYDKNAKIFTVYRDSTASLFIAVDKNDNIFISTVKHFLTELGLETYEYPINQGIDFNLSGEIINKFNLSITARTRSFSNKELTSLGLKSRARDLWDDEEDRWANAKRPIQTSLYDSWAKNNVKDKLTTKKGGKK